MQNEVFENVMNNGDSYMKAFLKVCEMLEPDTKWEKCEMITRFEGSNVLKKPNVYGFNERDSVHVYITTCPHESKGLQIVIYYSNKNDIVYQRSMWYYSFNWKGLMESSK